MIIKATNKKKNSAQVRVCAYTNSMFTKYNLNWREFQKCDHYNK